MLHKLDQILTGIITDTQGLKLEELIFLVTKRAQKLDVPFTSEELAERIFYLLDSGEITGFSYQLKIDDHLFPHSFLLPKDTLISVPKPVRQQSEIGNAILPNLILTHIIAAQGLKSTALAPIVVKDILIRGLNCSSDNVVHEMFSLCEEGHIVEVNYILPQLSYRTKSFFLPEETIVTIVSAKTNLLKPA